MSKNRRTFLKYAGCLAGASGFTAGSANSSMAADEKPANPDVKKRLGPFGNGTPITMAGYEYNRVQGLVTGDVTIAGCAHRFEVTGIGPLNKHAFYGEQTRDITEIGLIPFLLAFANGEFRDYVLLPIPLLRQFRHKSIFVRTDGDVRKPQDLRGRRVATVGYSSSGLTHVRGILQDEYGVSPSEIEWVTTQKDSAANLTGGVSRWEQVRPDGVTIVDAAAGEDESSLLLKGQVDAIFHPAEPRAFQERHPKVRRLFTDHRNVERAYYKRTGLFPIMHSVAVRTKTAQQHPWLAAAAFQAYCEAKKRDYLHMQNLGWVMDSLPWYGQELEETKTLMGDNFYPYGLKVCAPSYEKAIQYVYDQGLSKRKIRLEELFEPSTVDLTDTPFASA